MRVVLRGNTTRTHSQGRLYNNKETPNTCSDSWHRYLPPAYKHLANLCTHLLRLAALSNSTHSSQIHRTGIVLPSDLSDVFLSVYFFCDFFFGLCCCDFFFGICCCGFVCLFFYVILSLCWCFVVPTASCVLPYMEQVWRGVHRGSQRPVVPPLWGGGVGRAGQEPRQLGQLRGLLPGEGEGKGGGGGGSW